MGQKKKPTLNAFLAEQNVEKYETLIAALRADNRGLKSKLDALRREAHVQDRLIDAARVTLDALPPAPPPRPVSAGRRKDSRTVESAVLGCACWHIGETVRAVDTDGLSAYDFDIFCRRLQRLVDTTISFTQENMASYRFDELHILHLGDAISGEIHDELAQTNCLNIVEQATLGAWVTAQAVRELAAVFPRVLFTGVVGNHGRTRQKKYFKYKAQVNWDYVLYNYLALLLRDQPNVVVRAPLSPRAGVNIKGHAFHISHGDDIKAHMGIPFYGISRNVSRWVEIGASQAKFWRYFIRAHFHTGAKLQTAVGENILISSLKGGGDEYALGLPAFNPPQQLLFGVHTRRGKTWELPIEFHDTPSTSRYVYDRTRSLVEQGGT